MLHIDLEFNLHSEVQCEMNPEDPTFPFSDLADNARELRLEALRTLRSRRTSELAPCQLA